MRDTVRAEQNRLFAGNLFRDDSPVSMAQPYGTLRNSCEGLKSPSENLERGPKAWLGQTIQARALRRAGLEIAPDGALSGRVIVDLKSARATLSVGGKVKEPALRR